MLSSMFPLQPHRRRFLAGSGWTLTGLALALLVFLVLPAQQVRLGGVQLRGLVGSYLYERWEQIHPVECLRVTQVYLPNTLRLEWDDVGDPYGLPYKYVIYRDGSYLAETQQSYWVDSVSLEDEASYEYWVQIVPLTGDLGLPGPPPGPYDPDDLIVLYSPSEYKKLQVVIGRLEAEANQTVDSRLDKRYGSPVYQDFQFGSRDYRGGLFVGYAADPSRVGRSFLRFNLPAWEDDQYWAGSVCAYQTIGTLHGSVEVGIQTVDEMWNAATLKWTTSPTVDPGDPLTSFTVTTTGSGWAHWITNDDIFDALTGDGVLSVGLASTNEAAAGWAYFAKKEYDPSNIPSFSGTSAAPCVVFGFEPNGFQAPDNLEATYSGTYGHIQLNWTNRHNTTNQIAVERKEGSGAYSQVALLSANSTTWSDGSDVSGHTYTYRLAVEGDCGRNPSYSNTSTEAHP